MYKHAALVCFALVVGQTQAQNQGVASVKTHLLQRLSLQQTSTTRLELAANQYFELAKKANFDHAKLATTGAAPRLALQAARAAWTNASPTYESIEGIVAGVPLLAPFDLNLDAGASKADGGDAVVDFDLQLANGKTLVKPGNAFGINEGALWGTEASFSSNVKYDVDGDGKIAFGDQLPDAFVLKAGAQKLNQLTQALIETAKRWTPTSKDVFAALIANVPTVGPVFIDRWKTSRFVLGNQATRRDFNVISSLNDLQNNIDGWQKLYAGVGASVRNKNAALDKQILGSLSSLKTWVLQLEAQEQKKRFSPEQAEGIFVEGNNRATAITGAIVQAAALLNITIKNP